MQHAENKDEKLDIKKPAISQEILLDPQNSNLIKETNSHLL